MFFYKYALSLFSAIDRVKNFFFLFFFFFFFFFFFCGTYQTCCFVSPVFVCDICVPLFTSSFDILIMPFRLVFFF